MLPHLSPRMHPSAIRIHSVNCPVCINALAHSCADNLQHHANTHNWKRTLSAQPAYTHRRMYHWRGGCCQPSGARAPLQSLPSQVPCRVSGCVCANAMFGCSDCGPRSPRVVPLAVVRNARTMPAREKRLLLRPFAAAGCGPVIGPALPRGRPSCTTRRSSLEFWSPSKLRPPPAAAMALPGALVRGGARNTAASRAAASCWLCSLGRLCACASSLVPARSVGGGVPACSSDLRSRCERA